MSHCRSGRAVILIVIAVAWEAYAQRLNNPLLVPTFSATIEAFWGGIVSGDIPQKVSNSVQLLLKGYALGLALAMTLTALAIMSRIGTDLLVLAGTNLAGNQPVVSAGNQPCVSNSGLIAVRPQPGSQNAA